VAPDVRVYSKVGPFVPAPGHDRKRSRRGRRNHGSLRVALIIGNYGCTLNLRRCVGRGEGDGHAFDRHTRRTEDAGDERLIGGTDRRGLDAVIAHDLRRGSTDQPPAQ
jgi:hypothetical protein